MARVTEAFIEDIIKDSSNFLEIINKAMIIGKEYADEIGHKDYSSVEALFDDIEKGTSPIMMIEIHVSCLGMGPAPPS